MWPISALRRRGYQAAVRAAAGRLEGRVTGTSDEVLEPRRGRGERAA